MTHWEIATKAHSQPPHDRARRARWAFGIWLALGVWGVPHLALGSTAEERAVADALFREAKALMTKQDYEQACRKLEESQRLDPRDGTLLNLAVCHEKEGKIATALVEFEEALAAARRAKRWDRIHLATRRLKELKDKVPNLTIEVSPGAATDGFELYRNGVRIAEPAWGTAVPVDPGSYDIEAKAPGMLPWTNTFLVEEGDDKTVVVPILEAEPPPPEPEPEPEPEPHPEPQPEPDLSRRTTAYVVGGVGVLALGVGTYYGLQAISRSSESDDHCRGTLCDQQGLDLNDEAKRAANVSNIAMGLGLVGIGAGAYLLLTEEQEEDPKESGGSSLRLAPVAGAGQAAIFMCGRW